MCKWLLAVIALGAGCIPAIAQDYSKLTFNIGGGPTVPLNPSANYAGVGGNFTAGAGLNFNRKNSLGLEFLWTGLPRNVDLTPALSPIAHVNLYSIAANYRHHIDSLGGSRFGAYITGGGGWYYRVSSVDSTVLPVPAGTPCIPIYNWWGFSCDPSGLLILGSIASRNNSAGGVNAGIGLTARFGDAGLKVYVESRYHYAWNNRVPTTFIPVTFGIRFN
jgi:hypothetical protein